MSNKLGTTLNWISESAIASTTSWELNVGEYSSCSFQAVYSNNAPSADTFLDADVNTTNDTITLTAHAFVTGLKVAATTDGVLPTGLSAIDYYVIKVDANTIKLASSLANAEAGTAVNITAAAGGGTHTLTPATSASNVLKLQKSVDSDNWVDISDATVTIATSSGTTMFDVSDLPYNYLRLLYTPSAGSINLKVHLSTRS